MRKLGSLPAATRWFMESRMLTEDNGSVAGLPHSYSILSPASYPYPYVQPENVTLHSESNFANIIKVQILRYDNCAIFSRLAQGNYKGP